MQSTTLSPELHVLEFPVAVIPHSKAWNIKDMMPKARLGKVTVNRMTWTSGIARAAISMIGSGRPVRHGGMKLSQPPIDRPKEIYRAPNAAPGNPPSGRTRRGYFSSARKGGGVEQDRIRTQTIPEISGWRARPNFFGQIFLGKNFGNKNRVVSIPEERVLRQRRSRRS